MKLINITYCWVFGGNGEKNQENCTWEKLDTRQKCLGSLKPKSFCGLTCCHCGLQGMITDKVTNGRKSTQKGQIAFKFPTKDSVWGGTLVGDGYWKYDI